ncbi:MAG: arginine--tRNA ligase [Fimbriimonadaceae bacterium]|nr:arginine--tRNA ligase [Fimbriimonadaceae bacterium]QYK56130.1 MAG: arginine--tRNA ligase [Fimbriimonadaceae bacterium]
MLRSLVARLLRTALDRLVSGGKLPSEDYPDPEVQDTKDPAHGDFATNWAMVAVKQVKENAAGTAAPANPRELAALLVEALAELPEFAKVEVAGPGFVNLFLADLVFAGQIQSVLASQDRQVLADPSHFARPAATRQRINVEFVSVNPNGPITIGSGRGAAYGSALCNVLQASGNEVHREYYINDGVNSEQMRLFAESVRSLATGTPFPQKGYRGDYVQEVADRLKDVPVPDGAWQTISQDMMLKRQHADLTTFGVEFDTWFSEQSLHESGEVARCVAGLEASGVADERPVRTKLKLGKGGKVEEVEFEVQTTAVLDDEGEAPPLSPAGHDPVQAEMEGLRETLWLRSTLFGDDMDRVLRRADGRLTYIASDVAYHKDKFNRPSDADKLITVLGPDHHGYVNRLHAVVAANLMAGLSPSPSLGRGSGGGDTLAEQGLADWEAQLYGTAARRDQCRAARSLSDERLEVVIFQLVRFLKEGKPAPMRKRDGNIYALIDLVKEIGQKVRPDAPEAEQLEAGKDVARFFYLMRHHDTTFDFDLDLAEKQSDENPVFYVQYAHARITGVIDKAAEAGIAPPPAASPPSGQGPQPTDIEGAPELHPKERALLLKAFDLPYEIERSAEDYAVNRLATYAIELARAYHGFYDTCRVINADDLQTTQRRLAYCVAARTALRAALELLGVSAPSRM